MRSAALRNLFASLLPLGFCGLSLTHAQPAPMNPIAYQFKERWLGVNSNSLLLDVRLNEGGVIISASEGKLSPEETQTLAALILQAQDKAQEAANHQKTELPPANNPDTELARCSLFAAPGAKRWEYHFYTDADLPPCLKEVLNRLSTKAEMNQPIAAPSGFILCNDLARSFAPDGLTYAEMYRRNGIPFMPVERATFPLSFTPLSQAATHPGTLEKMSVEQMAEISKVPIKIEGSVLLHVEGRDVGCLLLPLANTENHQPALRAQERRKIIQEQPATSARSSR
jgi:hypothetical protein